MVECAGLEIRYTGLPRIEGSNPSLSATAGAAAAAPRLSQPPDALPSHSLSPAAANPLAQPNHMLRPRRRSAPLSPWVVTVLQSQGAA